MLHSRNISGPGAPIPRIAGGDRAVRDQVGLEDQVRGATKGNLAAGSVEASDVVVVQELIALREAAVAEGREDGIILAMLPDIVQQVHVGGAELLRRVPSPQR